MNGVGHRAIIGCVNQICIVVTSTAPIANSQTDLFEGVLVKGCMLIGEVVRRKMERVSPESVDTCVKCLGSGGGDIRWGSTQEVIESSIGTESEEFDFLVRVRKRFQEGEITFNFCANLLKLFMSKLKGANWGTQHLDAASCTRKGEA